MLERMKDKVDEEETLALAYGEIANTTNSVEDEIQSALALDQLQQPSQSADLAALKAKMGIT